MLHWLHHTQPPLLLLASLCGWALTRGLLAWLGPQLLWQPVQADGDTGGGGATEYRCCACATMVMLVMYAAMRPLRVAMMIALTMRLLLLARTRIWNAGKPE